MRSGRSRKNASVNEKAEAKLLPGDQEFENYLASAEYEVLQDPYRGLQSRQQSLETGTVVTTPWNACMWGTLAPQETEYLDEVAVVRHIGHCACPSMKAWTRKLHKNNKKRGKGKSKQRPSSSNQMDNKFAVGTRPTSISYRCQCDWNPLCLATLGGVVNDLLVQRSEEGEVQEPGEPEPMQVDTEIPRKPLHENLKEEIDGLSKMPATAVLESLEGSGRDKKEDENIFTFTGTDPNAKGSIIKLKPLGKNSYSAEGDPAGVFAMPMPNIDEEKIKYSPLTLENLKGVRKSFALDVRIIERHVSDCLRLLKNENVDNTKNLSLEIYMQTLVAWERALSFVGPSILSTLENKSISISLPPGIENLGATCYLNTQLQCLAQNPVFLNGIFSWRAGNSSHSMNPVISKMQSLLAQMALGGECKLSTLDFSNALGLQHNEQQDPNEFARLLFERMEESFQQCDHDGDLKNLLRRIFQGTTTYETICMTCGQSSKRSENFMDLNLPIVAQGKTKNNFRAMKISDYFGGKMVDTDVQHCLNEYLCPELLDGDNQYFCGKCGSKQDAKRVLKMTTLPPVLNVQLSRYVFDLSQFVKKKLSDKVLLPLTLILPKYGGDKVRYKLCAVMRHQGTSAYAGHYIAEAMDWVTGQWFEFNDEAVKHLPTGPSSSYEAQAPIEDIEVHIAPTGSKDAYNMYYVDEKFLKTSAIEEIVRRSSHLASGSSADKQDIVSKVSLQRNDKYQTLYDMCYADSLLADRLRRREIGIRKYMFPGPSSLAMVDGESFMWVDAQTLMQFLRLDHSLDEKIRSEGPILRHMQLLCEHKKLHPATSRKGKILNQSTFRVYASLLEAEQRMLRKQSKLRGDCQPVCDAVVTMDEIFCEQCAKNHRDQLATRLRQLKDIKELYNCLDSSLDNRDLQYRREGEEFGCSSDAFVYAVSKRMVTKYRNAVKGLIQAFSSLNDETTTTKLACSEDLFLEGLDCLDLSLFPCGCATGFSDMPSKQKTDDLTTELDRYFNSEIVCKHKNCNVMNDRRSVRFLSWSAWQKLKAVFPEAIELKLARAPLGERFKDDGCVLCQEERTLTESTISEFRRWAKDSLHDPKLKHLLQDDNWSNFPETAPAPADCYRLVHRKDLRNWITVVKKLSDSRKLCSINQHELREDVFLMVAPTHRKQTLQWTHVHEDKFRTSLLPLICQERRLVIQDYIFQRSKSSPDKEESTRALAPWVALLTDETHRSFVASFGKLLQILHQSYVDEENDEIKCQSKDEEIDACCVYLAASDRYHPIIRCISKEENDMSCNIFSLSWNGSAELFRVSPSLGEIGQCTENILSLLSAENECEDDPKGNSINHTSNNSKKSLEGRQSMVCGDGTNPKEPILVESDVECDGSPKQYRARVFDLMDTGSVNEAIDCLDSKSGFSPVEEEKGFLVFVRRSTRRKKSRYPLGCLVSEMEVNVHIHLNVAALKLLLFERCQVSITGRKLTLALFWKGKHQGQLEILSEWIERPISDLVEDILLQCGEKLSNGSCEPSVELHIFHQRDTAGSAQALHESVMDALLQAANFDEPDENKTPNNKKRKRKRSTERGFQGTLLHSGPSAPNTTSDSSDDETENETDAVCSNDGKVAFEKMKGTAKKPRPYMSDSDDDIPEASPFASRQTKKATATEGRLVHDEVVVIENTQEEPASKSERSNDTPTMHERVVAQVLSILGESVDQSTCWDAVESVMRMHPEEKNQELLVRAVFNEVLK